MLIVAKTGREDIATVYIAKTADGKKIEFVQSLQPPVPIEKKWILIISSLYGCPVNCRFCDAGGDYKGILSKEDLLFQIDYLVKTRFQGINIPVEKFKIQFARVGEPVLNNNVLDVLEELPKIYNAPGLMPSISTVAPAGREKFFERLLYIKQRLYKEKFQMQFSVHSTEFTYREWLMPFKKWSFEEISEYGREFFKPGDRKITLNFALSSDVMINPDVLLKYFDPAGYLIKITPLNPTVKAFKNNLSSYIQQNKTDYELVSRLRNSGYDVIISFGEFEENNIGSNCGQYITNYEKSGVNPENSYTYELERV